MRSRIQPGQLSSRGASAPAGLRALAAGHRAPHDGRSDGADAALAEVIVAARADGHDAADDRVLGHRALVAADRGAWHAATTLVAESDAIAPASRVEGYRVERPVPRRRIGLTIYGGDITGARRELARARVCDHSCPPRRRRAVQWLIAFARAHLAVDDPVGARALIAQARDVLRDRPDLGAASCSGRAPGDLGDTGAQVPPGCHGPYGCIDPRLGFLPYYLSFKEIGQRLESRDHRQVTGTRDLRQAGRGDAQRRRRPRC